MKMPDPYFSNEERIAMATRCHDCDDVPKVADAGMVFEMVDGARVQVMHNGLKIVADGYYGQWMTDLIRLCRGHHETQEERLFHEVVKRLPGDATMIELGGFWSYYSLWFLMNQPERRSVVIEPEPNNLAVGQANASLNGLSPLFKQGFAGGIFDPSADFQCEVSGWQRIPRYSVARLMEEQGWPRLDLLHCDIQGAETEVLESCRALFRGGQINWVFVSTHAHQISGDPLTHQRCLAILRECGATIEAEHDVHESFSGDGLIVARFGPPPTDWVPIHLSTNRASQSLFRHLAYDLHECRQHCANLLAAETVRENPIHESLVATGTLLTLRDDGPLGVAGTTLALPDDQVMSPAVRASASWEFDNVKSFADCVEAGKSYTLVDIGANVGLFSRQIVRLVPSIEHLLCVEPDPGNFKALRYNLADLGDRATLFQTALSDSDGELDLLRDAENFGNYSLNADAMRNRPHDAVRVAVRSTQTWMSEQLGGCGPILWKSDTQGYDELVVAQTPMAIWQKVDVALMEMWRIAKPNFDLDTFRERIDAFPNRQLGDQQGVESSDVIEYLSGDDWQFKDLLLWR